MEESLVERARRERTPLIDGHTATFIWEGESAPRLIADFNGWEGGGADLERLNGGVWGLRVDLPEDAYVEYAYVVGDEWVRDPFNPRRITNGMGKMNHFFYMPAANPPVSSRPRKGVPAGRVTSAVLDGEAFVVGGKRKVYFYQPPVDVPSPLLVVLDGQDYFRRARLNIILDNLIHDGRTRPVAMAMPEHGRQARLLEYGCADITLGFFHEILLPAARERLNLVDFTVEPGSYGIMGASMGGLMALYTGMRIPDILARYCRSRVRFPSQALTLWSGTWCVQASRGTARSGWM